MVTTVNRRKLAVLALIMLASAFVVSASAFAQEGAAAEGPTTGLTVGDGLRIAGLALGAGIAIAGSALATGRVQAAVGAGGTGALAEKPDLFGLILVLIAIPETLVIFGFVIAIMLWIQI